MKIRTAHADVFSVTGTGLHDILTSEKAPGKPLINIGDVEFNGLKLPFMAAESHSSPGAIIRSMKDRIGDGFHGATVGRSICWGGYLEKGGLSLLLAMRQPGKESSVMYSCELDVGAFAGFLKGQAQRQPVSLDNHLAWFSPEPMSQCLDKLVLGKKPVSCILYNCRSMQSIPSLRQWYAGAGKKAGWQVRSLRDKPDFLMLTKEGKECYFSFKNDIPGYTAYTLLTVEND